MKKYILTKTDGDFPVGSIMFIDGNYAYIEYEGDHPVGYDAESIMYKGVAHRVIGFRWSFLKGYGYEAKEVYFMPYGVVPPKDQKRRPCSTVEINGVPVTAHFEEAPIQAHPVQLTIRSKIKLPDELATFAPWGNNLSSRFEGSPEMKRSWGRRKVVYEGYITHTRLEGVLRLIAEYSGVTATVVYL